MLAASRDGAGVPARGAIRRSQVPSNRSSPGGGSRGGHLGALWSRLLSRTGTHRRPRSWRLGRPGCRIRTSRARVNSRAGALLLLSASVTVLTGIGDCKQSSSMSSSCDPLTALGEPAFPALTTGSRLVGDYEDHLTRGAAEKLADGLGTGLWSRVYSPRNP